MIGNNINLLQTSISECTNFGLLIKYIKKKEDICLIEVEKQISINKVFIKEKEKGKIYKGENQIKNIIKELNNNKTKELKYYILKIPIKFLDEYNDEKINQIKDKIEFLDFPGLYTSSNNKENNLINTQDLLKCIDGFLFLYKEKYFDNDLIKLIKNIQKNVKERNSNFSFKTCLFIRTFIDEDDEYDNQNVKKYKEKMKEDIKKHFSQSQNLTFDRINWENQEKFDELHVTLFSYLFYKQYIEFENKIENISYFIKEDEEMNNEEILENLLEEISNQIDNESIYLNFNENDENFKDVLKTLKTILINKYKFEEFDLVKNEKKIKEIVKNFLYVKKNKKLSKDYINSNIEDTIKELKYTINNAAEYHSNDRNFQIVDFVINVYTSFHDIKMRIVDEQYSINEKMFNICSFSWCKK